MQQCRLCKQILVNNQQLSSHIKDIHNLNMNEYSKNQLNNSCLICGVSYNTRVGLMHHITRTHKVSIKDYYDKYFKVTGEGVCCCGKETKFYKNYYSNYCSSKCAANAKITRSRAIYTNMKLLGVENPFKSKEIQEKIKETNNKLYGVNYPGQSEKIKFKIKETCMKKYGKEHALQVKSIRDKGKETFKIKYGFEYYSQTQEMKDKAENTCLNRYGVRHALQNKEIYENKQKTAHNTKSYILPSGKLIYKQGYEPQFLDYVFKNNILKEDEIVYYTKHIKYVQSDNKIHHYVPDFYIPKWNLIVEVKSWYTEKADKYVILKEQACIRDGFKYLRIVDNNFDTLTNFIKENTEPIQGSV